jgi:hypothetical protein
MSTPITITATVPAWLFPHFRVDTLLERARKGEPCTDMLCFHTWDVNRNRNGGDGGYIRIGEAQITIELGSEDELVQAKVQALRDQIDAARAAFLTRQQEILDQIQKLQALPMAEVVG